MATFRDNQDREWLVPVNVASIERAKAVAGVNITDIAKGELYDQLDTDCFLLSKILFGLCRPQLAEHGVSEEAFYAAIQGEPLEAGRQAILRGLIDFFPKRLRERLGAMQSLEAKLAGLNDRQREILLDSVTSFQESSQPTPGLEPSDS